MEVTVSEGSLEVPVYSTASASLVEVRDGGGRLVAMVKLYPGGDTILVSRAGDDDFEHVAKEHHVPLLGGGRGAARGAIILG